VKEKMKIQEARNIGQELAALIEKGELTQAFNKLSPLLSHRIAFTHSGEIGRIIGACNKNQLDEFLDLIAEPKDMGCWPVIGMALNQQLSTDMPHVFSRCRHFMIYGDEWYCADILSERVPGPALLEDFQQALNLLADYRSDENRWVRRSVGVAIHLWGKRVCGDSEYDYHVKSLLTLVQPMFEERNRDTVKGIGWGIKTLGKYYPDIVSNWLINEVGPNCSNYRALMLKKATTYLPPEYRQIVLESFGR
jgi:hypothetical protein